MTSQQLALDLGLRPAHGREDFLLAPCNESAVALLDAWPDWPGPAAAIYGAAGCGKSHLAAVWQARTGADAIDAGALKGANLPDILPDGGRSVLEVREAEIAGNRVREEALLHFYNLTAECGGSILFVARTAPARWPVELPDLRSRLAAVPAVSVGQPDDDLIAAVLVKLFADRQLRVGQDVIAYMLPRMARSFEAAQGLVDDIDRAAMSERRSITVPLVGAVLKKTGH